MERFYDGDQDQLFTEARVINPFRKSAVITRPKVCTLYINGLKYATHKMYILRIVCFLHVLLLLIGASSDRDFGN